MRLKKYLNEGIGRLGLHLMKNPAGTYSFVGSVPVALGWLSKSGKELTPDEAKEVSMANMPAMLAKTRIFKTPQEAFKVAKKYGYKEKDISFNEESEKGKMAGWIAIYGGKKLEIKNQKQKIYGELNN